MNVLVTGGSSLLGRTVANLLVDRGDHVRCFQRGTSGSRAKDVRGDIRDRSSLLRAAKDCDSVVHLAALVAPKAAWVDMVSINVDGTRNALAAATECGKFIHISSPSVAFHDEASVGVAALAANYDGRDGYVRSKAIAENLVRSESSVPTVVLRPHLVWGPGDTQLIGRIIDRARAGRLVLPDGGRALVDTTYIDDAAAAIVAGLDHCQVADEATTIPLVVTGGEPRPLGDLVASILRAAGITRAPRSLPAPLASFIGSAMDRLWLGSEPPLTHFAARQLSVAHWFDQRETQRILGWAPVVGLEEGFARLAQSLSGKGLSS
ncbi:MAG: NAD-dependent epimerase/dehydratase family protein [Acidimicrobiales bacterium]